MNKTIKRYLIMKKNSLFKIKKTQYFFINSLFFLIISLFYSCDNGFNEWGYVNFYIDPESTEYYNLNYGNRGWEYFEGGNRGVVIFRKNYSEFVAFERSCTAKDCNGRLYVDSSSNVLLVCPECGSKFIYYDGSPLSGSKAKRSLYQYCTYFDNQYLYVNNCNAK
jgi:nitrite reductase/ring-hydroxylating ferredoxin subunit